MSEMVSFLIIPAYYCVTLYFTVQASSSVSTESSPTKPSTLPRTSSLVKQRTPSDPKAGIPEVNGKCTVCGGTYLLIVQHLSTMEHFINKFFLNLPHPKTVMLNCHGKVGCVKIECCINCGWVGRGAEDF